jgi:membrane protein YqaA with SNARE-associated domain
MSSIKQSIARKAVKSTAKHTAHGAASKLKRDPVRTTTLLGIGCVAGGVAGWTLARAAGPPPAETTGGPA